MKYGREKTTKWDKNTRKVIQKYKTIVYTNQYELVEIYMFNFYICLFQFGSAVFSNVLWALQTITSQQQ